MNAMFIKFIKDPKNWFTIIGGTITGCALYFGIIARIDHLESKIDKYIAVKEEQTKLNNYEISVLKIKNIDQDKDLKDIQRRMFTLYAILPKENGLKIESE